MGAEPVFQRWVIWGIFLLLQGIGINTASKLGGYTQCRSTDHYDGVAEALGRLGVMSIFPALLRPFAHLFPDHPWVDPIPAGLDSFLRNLGDQPVPPSNLCPDAVRTLRNPASQDLQRAGERQPQG
ncbi:MAG: hypothetical protein ABSH08_05885, partial [Tepidisphaeraceae bacterium]